MARPAVSLLLLLACGWSAPLAVAAEAVPLPALVAVHEAWIALPPPAARVAAGYLAIENRGAVPRRLVAVTSVAFARVELHETYRAGDRSKMRRVAEGAVPARGALTLAPGGMHLMLFDPLRPLVAGDAAELTLAFDDGTRIVVRAVVRDLRAAEPHAGH